MAREEDEQIKENDRKKYKEILQQISLPAKVGAQMPKPKTWNKGPILKL